MVENQEPPAPAPAQPPSITPASPGGEPAGGKRARPPRPKKPHRKISWRISALVTVILIGVTVIILLTFLLGGYNNYKNIKQVVNGANVVKIEVDSSRDTLLKNGADVLSGEKILRDILKGMGAQDVQATIVPE